MQLLPRTLGVYATLCSLVTPAFATDKPNILVIWGDDIGWSNVGAYNHAVMGYQTPNIDRIANEGVLFTDHYAQPGGVYHRPIPNPLRHDDGRPAWRCAWPAKGIPLIGGGAEGRGLPYRSLRQKPSG